eukprot:TRINITY_DN8149_c0_g1_i1.p1 TRINITY_DN8149_c0_g1~~TRINITY_DN8149_c0_g1_i1.p1  ORF type:complete len:539 (+),score=49.44 TRINITY_DN8149_c0_g1_i1:90-1619(+)
MAAPAELRDETSRSCRLSDLVMLIVMPALGYFMPGSPFSVVPLQYAKQGWPLWHLGALQLFAFMVRPVFGAALATVGSWPAVFYCLSSLVCIVPACIWPNSELAVSLQLLAIWGPHLEVAWQALAFKRFASSPHCFQQVTRMQVLSGTTGYAVSPFATALTYDFLGGWRACAVLHVIIYSCLTLTYATNSQVWQDWRQWRNSRNASSEDAVGAVGDSLHGAVPAAQLEIGKAGVKGDGEKGGLTRSMSSVESQRSTSFFGLPRDLLWPVVAMAVAHFASNWSYMCEWATFAVFFKDEHNWTNAFWAGFAQMIGDIAGASLLVMASSGSQPVVADESSEPALHTEARGTERSWIPKSLFGKPYNLSWLLLAWVLTNFGLAAPSLDIAIICQVLMGTTYVFFMQYINEMSMLYSFGCTKTYLKLQSLMQSFFAIGCAFAGLVSLYLYEAAGRLVPFYVSGCVSAVALVFYTVVFLLRAGCSSTLEVVEYERRNREAVTDTVLVQVVPAAEA